MGRVLLLALAALLAGPPPGTVVQHVATGLGPDGMAVGDGALWVANVNDTTVTRIDLRTRKARKVPAGPGPIAVAVAGPHAWVADYQGSTVKELDGSSGRTLATVKVGSKPVGLAVAGPDLWVLNQADGTASIVGLQSATV